MIGAAAGIAAAVLLLGAVAFGVWLANRGNTPSATAPPQTLPMLASPTPASSAPRSKPSAASHEWAMKTSEEHNEVIAVWERTESAHVCLEDQTFRTALARLKAVGSPPDADLREKFETWIRNLELWLDQRRSACAALGSGDINRSLQESGALLSDADYLAASWRDYGRALEHIKLENS